MLFQNALVLALVTMVTKATFIKYIVKEKTAFLGATSTGPRHDEGGGVGRPPAFRSTGALA